MNSANEQPNPAAPPTATGETVRSQAANPTTRSVSYGTMRREIEAMLTWGGGVLLIYAFYINFRLGPNNPLESELMIVIGSSSIAFIFGTAMHGYRKYQSLEKAAISLTYLLPPALFGLTRKESRTFVFPWIYLSIALLGFLVLLFCDLHRRFGIRRNAPVK